MRGLIATLNTTRDFRISSSTATATARPGKDMALSFLDFDQDGRLDVFGDFDLDGCVDVITESPSPRSCFVIRRPRAITGSRYARRRRLRFRAVEPSDRG